MPTLPRLVTISGVNGQDIAASLQDIVSETTGLVKDILVAPLYSSSPNLAKATIRVEYSEAITQLP